MSVTPGKDIALDFEAALNILFLYFRSIMPLKENEKTELRERMQAQKYAGDNLL